MVLQPGVTTPGGNTRGGKAFGRSALIQRGSHCDGKGPSAVPAPRWLGGEPARAAHALRACAVCVCAPTRLRSRVGRERWREGCREKWRWREGEKERGREGEIGCPWRSVSAAGHWLKKPPGLLSNQSRSFGERVTSIRAWCSLSSLSRSIPFPAPQAICSQPGAMRRGRAAHSPLTRARPRAEPSRGQGGQARAPGSAASAGLVQCVQCIVREKGVRLARVRGPPAPRCLWRVKEL
jgi:hypothetical protein